MWEGREDVVLIVQSYVFHGCSKRTYAVVYKKGDGLALFSRAGAARIVFAPQRARYVCQVSRVADHLGKKNVVDI